MRSVTVGWPGGEHEFRLGLGELRALQKNCDAGPEHILNRIRTGQWLIDDLIEIHRLGLIGSEAFSQSEAGPLVTRLFEQHPHVAFKLTALRILAFQLLGEPDDEPKKPEAGTTTTESETLEESGNSRKSTE